MREWQPGRMWAVGVALCVVVAACTAAGDPPGPGSDAPSPPLPDRPWPMHTIAGTYRGANGLGVGDVNSDGYDDYVTNYEFDQRYILSLHPGPTGDADAPWPQVQVWPPNGRAPSQGFGVNPENSTLADVDGDGRLDILGAQGESQLEFWEGNSPGIRVIFGPEPGRAADPHAWTDAGRVPATTTFGHLHYVVALDVNGDGVDDIVAGGRRSSTTHDYAGAYWLEAPADPAARRDLSAYVIHTIDATLTSGHGMTPTDVDQDGDDDIVVANPDFDTDPADQAVYWYENPGPTSPVLRDPWVRRTIFQAPEFHTKPQIGVGDLDRDGLVDYVSMTTDHVLWFHKTSLDPVTFEVVKIPKDPTTRWLTRPVKVFDVNGDGRLDLVGMTTHSKSTLPQSTPAAFWMEFTGDVPTADNWVTHAIRWGSGTTAWISEFGEKWDQVSVTDVDRDGDLDLVANCEEWWMQQPLEVQPYYDPLVAPSTVAVVWFENIVGEDEPSFGQTGDLVVAEAEHATRVDDGAWTARGSYPGAEGSGYLQAHNALSTAFDTTLPDADRLAGFVGPTTSPGVHYRVLVDGGRYTVWVRRWAPFHWGYPGLGGSGSDSAWLSVDAGPSMVVGDRGGPFDHWQWERLTAPLDLAPGEHDLAIRQRDRGYAIDRIALSADPDFVPSGRGPSETGR